MRLVRTAPPRTVEAIDAELRELGATLADQLANGNRIDELLEERQALVQGDG